MDETYDVIVLGTGERAVQEFSFDFSAVYVPRSKEMAGEPGHVCEGVRACFLTLFFQKGSRSASSLGCLACLARR
jgi:hypothetical protein